MDFLSRTSFGQTVVSFNSGDLRAIPPANEITRIDRALLCSIPLKRAVFVFPLGDTSRTFSMSTGIKRNRQLLKKL